MEQPISVFVVPKCKVRGCQHYRQGDRCAKDGFSIEAQMRFVAMMHESDLCEVRRQMNTYRLNKMLDS